MPVDDEGLAQALMARVRMDRAHREAMIARGEFNAAVVDLHRAGASMREIADALDISHQRVHQIIDRQPSFWQRMTRQKPRQPVVTNCSFCGRSQFEVQKLVAGPGVYICDVCIRGSRPNLDPDVDVRCSFCGKRRRDVRSMTARDDVRICDSCVSLCLEVLAEDERAKSR